MTLRFFVGVHDPYWAHRVPAACISVNRLRRRRGPFVPPPGGWIMDSGAFTTISTHGRYLSEPADYADEARRWVALAPGLQAVVAQDFMCEPFILERTGLTLADHQRLTIERLDALEAAWGEPVPVLPVLQGFAPEDYARHVSDYGSRLTPGRWVGVGSVCKRQGDPSTIVAVLRAVKEARPDLRLHGFGVKLTALKNRAVRELLHSADSMAWSFHARMQGRDANDPEEAIAFVRKVEALSEAT